MCIGLDFCDTVCVLLHRPHQRATGQVSADNPPVIIKCCATPAGPQRAAVAKMCVRYLREEVRLVQPKVILIWGQMAYSAMFGDDTNIISVRGEMRRFEQIPAIATHHPLECIRSPKLKGPVWNDVRTVLSLLKPSSPVSGGVAGERPPHGG